MPLTPAEAGDLHAAVLALLNSVNAGPTPYRRAAREYERVLHECSLDPPPPTGLIAVVAPAGLAGPGGSGAELGRAGGTGHPGRSAPGRYRPSHLGERP